MNCPYHTEAPEKVRELPEVKPAGSHHGEGPRGVILLVLFFALFAAVVWGAVDVYLRPQNHYPIKIKEWSVAEAPADEPSDEVPGEEGSQGASLQPLTTMAPSNGLLGSQAAGANNIVARLGEHELTNQMFIYYYWDCFYSLFESMGSYLTTYLDFNKPFDQQYVNDTQNWHQYLSEMAVETWRQTVLLNQAAAGEGYTLTADYEQQLTNTEASLGEYADKNGYDSKDGYLQMMFDPSAELESYRTYTRESINAAAFADSKYQKFYDDNFDPAAKVQYCVNVRHILIQAEDADNADSMAAAKNDAEALYKEWLIIPTEDHFQELASTHTMDTGSALNGGLYEDVYPGQMVTSFNDWCFDESRQPGDHGIVESEYGYHLMYFVGESDTVYSDENATAAQNAYNAWLDTLFVGSDAEYLLENVVFTEKAE